MVYLIITLSLHKSLCLTLRSTFCSVKFTLVQLSVMPKPSPLTVAKSLFTLMLSPTQSPLGAITVSCESVGVMLSWILWYSVTVVSLLQASFTV